MIQINNKLRVTCLVIISGLFLLTACNKELEQFPAIPTPTYPTGNGMAATIAASPNDSLYSRLIVRSGLAPVLNDLTKSFTMFITDNAGMRIFVNAASGGAVPINAPDAVFSGFIANSLPVASAQGIVMYNTVGQKFPASSFPATFPNFPLPTQIVLDPSQAFVRMPIFPAKGTPYSYVNNIPLTGVDQAASNGIIHHGYTIVAPPTTVLAGLIYPDPNLSYFTAAIARADSGQTGLNKFDSLFKYGVTNMTVLAPNNAAFQTLIYGTAYGFALSLGAPPALADAQANGALALGPAIFTNPAFYGLLSASTVRGILAYHILASNTSGSYKPDIRAFSVNFSPTAGVFVKTLVNGALAVHPGVMAQATFTGPAVTSLKFTGLGTFPPGGAPYSGAPATAVSIDKHAANGVLHIIDRVLLPQ